MKPPEKLEELRERGCGRCGSALELSPDRLYRLQSVGLFLRWAFLGLSDNHEFGLVTGRGGEK